MAHTVSRKAGANGLLTAQSIKVRRNLRDSRFLYSSLLAAFISLAVVSVFLWSRLTVVDTGYKISKASIQRDELIERNKRLRIEYQRLKSPERIEPIATRELGMVYPEAAQIIKVR